jgi:anti-sigma-K factor RskA
MIDHTMTSEEFPQWFTDLLLLRATDGLDVEQQNQFDQFVTNHPDRDRIELEAEKYELTAAAIDLSIQNSVSEDAVPLPGELRRKVLDGATKHFANVAPQQDDTPSGELKQALQSGSSLTSREALAWFAAAAAVVLLLTGWNPFGNATPSIAVNTPIEVPSVSIEEKFSEFTNGNPDDLTRIDWSATGSNSVTAGEVVWSDVLQEGYMIFQGLKPNNPSKSQYQLWIFDTDPSQEHPVDGGVFDIAANGKVIIPIDARIPVTKAVMFAITEEKPGGVVVSDRKRLPLLAKVD